MSLFNSSAWRLTWVNELTMAPRRQALQDMRSPLIPISHHLCQTLGEQAGIKGNVLEWKLERKRRRKTDGRDRKIERHEKRSQNDRQVRQPFKTIKAWINSLERFQCQARPKCGSEGKARERI